MAGFEQREGGGVLFKNDKKGVETRPDYTGNILINGKEMWLSAWIKEGKNGKFMSLSAQPKDAPKEKSVQKNVDPFDNDDIPF